MRLLRRTARAALVGLSTLALATACGEPTGTVELPGVYNLAAVNDAPLPFVISQTSTETEEISEGYVDLDASGRFSDVTVYRTSGPGITPQEVIDEFTGDYEVVGNEVVFYPDEGAQYTMVVSGRTLTQTITSGSFTDTFRYTK